MYSRFIWLLGICALSVCLILNTLNEIKVIDRLNKVEKSVEIQQKILERLERSERLETYNIVEKTNL